MMMSVRKPYSNVEIFSEEACRKEQHGTAIVVTIRDGIPWMRVIPSVKWPDPPSWVALIGLINHESIHICLWRRLGMEYFMALDRLPEPKTVEEYLDGVWGYGR